MIDSHCHIGLNLVDITGLLMRAQLAGVQTMLSVACYLPEYAALLQLLDKYPTLYGAFGIHPEYSGSCPTKEALISKLMAHPRIIGVGETGLDYHYLTEPKEKQRPVFEQQIEVAHAVKKPIIIHTRDADEDTIAILESADKGGLLKYGGVMHCFTGSQRLAEYALKLGFYISASGIITFKMADEVRSVFKTIPNDRLLIETDSPYLAPVPYRSKINEPSYIVKTAEKLAEIKGVSLKEIDRITTSNFMTLFKIEEEGTHAR